MAVQPHILIVEDDREISVLVSRVLKANDFRVSTARDGREMDRVLAAARIDLMVLDVMLPGEDGLAICRRIRAGGSLPIIIVSARGEEIDRVVGLEVGADDYLAKPFGARELLARVRAILRRSVATAGARLAIDRRRYCFDGWVVDTGSHLITDPTGAQVTLTAGEFDLLAVFCERAGMVLSRDQLVDLTRGRLAGPFERSVDILVSRLRRKLGPRPDGSDLIRTVRSEGYVFVPPVTG